MRSRISQLADYCASTVHPGLGPAIRKAYAEGKMAAVWRGLAVLSPTTQDRIRAEYRRINRATYDHYQAQMAAGVAAARASTRK